MEKLEADIVIVGTGASGLLSLIHILKENLDREFNRDALYFAYVVTKNKELLNIYQESEKGDVKVCRALDLSLIHI